MQLYAGLPIITNKITQAEQQGVPHHLLGCIDLHEQTWVVSTFVRRALKVIEEIRARGRLPILVGGTHYYTQSLLFHEVLTDDDGDEPLVGTDKSPEEQWPMLAQPTEVLLQELRKVDPVMASRWHPNDRRKIQRSMMIYLQTGVPASKIYAEQQNAKTGAREQYAPEDISASLLRCPTLIFWVHTEPEVLRSRLDDRVDAMLEHDLLEEVNELQQHAANEHAQGRPIDETRGIWVSIGFKEFKPYHEALANSLEKPAVSRVLSEGIERTKIANRQYAKRQVRWIRLKLLDALAQAGSRDELYLLDSGDVSKFDELVVRPATELTNKFLKGEERPVPSSVSAAAAEHLSASDQDSKQQRAVRVVEHCMLCDVTCSTDLQWAAHVRSKKHRKMLSIQRKNGVDEPT